MTPRNSQSSDNVEFDHIPVNGVTYETEDEQERISEVDAASNTDTGARTEPDYQRLFNASIPTTHRRYDEGPSSRTPMVEVPDDILSSSSTPTSRPSQQFNTVRVGPSTPQRARSQTHPNHQRDRSRSQERARYRQNEHPQRNPGPFPPFAGADIAPAPHMHLYHFYANHGERIIDIRLGSSLQHVAIDITHNEGEYQIRAWYAIPPPHE